MFNMEDILARLQNGEDAQAIANEFADVVNQANKVYADQKAKEEAERKAKEKAEKEKVQKARELQDILDDLAEWYSRYYNLDGADMDIKAEDIIQMADEIVNLSDGLSAVLGVKPGKASFKVKKSGNADSVINDFLKSMGW